MKPERHWDYIKNGLPKTDEEILSAHVQSVRPRCRMELKIVNAFIRELKKNNCTVKIEEYEDEPEMNKIENVKSALFNIEDAFVIVYNENGKRIGWVRFVFGNDGWDLINDYSVNIEEWLQPVLDVADKLANGLE